MTSKGTNRERRRYADRKSAGGEKSRPRRKSRGRSGRSDERRQGDAWRGGGSGDQRQGKKQGERGRRRSGGRGGRQGGRGGQGGQGGGNYGSGVTHDHHSPRAGAQGRTGNFEDLFTEASKTVRAIGTRLREIVHDVLPEAEERVYPTWKIALYNEPFEVCGIQLVGKHCNLYFSNGARMNDPAGLLEGSGRSIRHVKVKSTDDPPEDQLKDLIREAKKVGRG